MVLSTAGTALLRRRPRPSSTVIITAPKYLFLFQDDLASNDRHLENEIEDSVIDAIPNGSREL